MLYHSAELTAAASSTPVVGEFSWSVPLPTDPVYLGQEFFFQGLHLDLGLLPTSVAAMSNAVGIRIGDQ